MVRKNKENSHSKLWVSLLVLATICLVVHEFLVPYELSGHVLSIIAKTVILGILFYLAIFFKPNPLTQKKLARFRSIRRGYWSFLILMALLVVTVFGKLLIDKRAIIVKYEGKYYFPTYTAFIPGTEFGFDYNYETNYRDLKQRFKEEGSDNWVLMPFVPYDPLENHYYKEDIKPPYPIDFEARHFLVTDRT